MDFYQANQSENIKSLAKSEILVIQTRVYWLKSLGPSLEFKSTDYSHIVTTLFKFEVANRTGFLL